MSEERTPAGPDREVVLVERWLVSEDACPEGAAWARPLGSFERLWRECRVTEWLIWSLRCAGYRDERALRRFSVACVRRYHQLWEGEPLEEVVAAAEGSAAGVTDRHALLAAWQRGRRALEARARSAGWTAARAAGSNAAVACARLDPIEAARTAALECLHALAWEGAPAAQQEAEQTWQTDRLRQEVGGDAVALMRAVRARAADLASARGLQTRGVAGGPI